MPHFLGVRMAAVGGKGSFDLVPVNGGNAPISDFPALIPERGGSTHSRPSPEERYVGDVAPKAARRP